MPQLQYNLIAASLHINILKYLMCKRCFGNIYCNARMYNYSRAFLSISDWEMLSWLGVELCYSIVFTGLNSCINTTTTYVVYVLFTIAERLRSILYNIFICIALLIINFLYISRYRHIIIYECTLRIEATYTDFI